MVTFQCMVECSGSGVECYRGIIVALQHCFCLLVANVYTLPVGAGADVEVLVGVLVIVFAVQTPFSPVDIHPLNLFVFVSSTIDKSSGTK